MLSWTRPALVLAGLALPCALVACPSRPPAPGAPPEAGDAEVPRPQPVPPPAQERDPSEHQLEPPGHEPAPSPVGAVPKDQWATDARVEASRQQLSTKLGAPASDITVVSVENIQWSNGALGCPKPDMAYTQAIVEGYRIVLQHGGTSYAFHGRTGQDPFLCE
ncbi:MAG: hypothetical protein K0V04_00410 [Deltaproteobacteria bacterium]|nr:hypothetical protein [Deltaproteobacteria bacterium]